MATNYSSGINSGIQGAMMGGQIGGVWGAAIGGGIGLLSGIFQDKQQRKVIDKYNDELTKLHAQDLFKLQSEQNLEAMRTAKALLSYQDNQRVAASTYNAQFGAAEMIGSSAEALGQVLDFQTSEAKAGVLLNYEISADNYNTTIDQLTNQRQASLKRTTGDQSNPDFASLVKTGLDVYSMYRNGNMSGMFGDSKVSAGGSGFFGTFTKGGDKTYGIVNKIR